MAVTISYWVAITELKALLNMPLPGGRGFQRDRDKRIRQLCKVIADSELPDRG